MSDLEQRFDFSDRYSGAPMDLDILHDGKALHWVLPRQRARFKLRSKYCAWRIDQFFITKDPDHWRVLDIKVHGRSQLIRGAVPDDPNDDGVPGSLFDTPHEITFDTVQTAMELSIDVMYVGPNPEGQPFACSARCTIAR